MKTPLSKLLKDGVDRGTTLVGARAPTLPPPPRAAAHWRGRVPVTGDSPAGLIRINVATFERSNVTTFSGFGGDVGG